MQTIVTPALGTINLKDLGKGILVTVGAALLGGIYPVLKAGSFNIDWVPILSTSLAAGVSYIIKNLSDAAKIVITNPPAEVLEAVKKGDAVVDVKAV